MKSCEIFEECSLTHSTGDCTVSDCLTCNLADECACRNCESLITEQEQKVRYKMKRRVLISRGDTENALVLETTDEPNIICVGIKNEDCMTTYLHLTKQELLNTVTELCTSIT